MHLKEEVKNHLNALAVSNKEMQSQYHPACKQKLGVNLQRGICTLDSDTSEGDGRGDSDSVRTETRKVGLYCFYFGSEPRQRDYGF